MIINEDITKVIFMDCDGVLNYSQWYSSDRNPGNIDGNEGDIDPLCVERIIRICNETGAKIVLSSDWRISWPGSLIRLENGGFPKGLIIDKTPEHIWKLMGYKDYMLSEEEDEDYKNSRGSEIDEWLKLHPQIINYVIIDDRTDFTENQQPHFVHVDSYKGLTDEDTELAIGILNTF